MSLSRRLSKLERSLDQEINQYEDFSIIANFCGKSDQDHLTGSKQYVREPGESVEDFQARCLEAERETARPGTFPVLFNF